MAVGANDIDVLVAAAIDGDGAAVAVLDRWLTSARATRDTEAASRVLDAVAREAAAGSEPAVDLLLSWITRHRLAQSAIGRVLVDPDDVDDALQETLFAVSKGISSFEGRARLTTWLHRVAYTTALRVVERRARGGTPTDDVPDPAAVPGAIRRMSSLVATRQAVEHALRQLPDHYRQPLVLREFEQRSYEEIAELLDLPIGTVRSRIARGRQQVAAQLRS